MQNPVLSVWSEGDNKRNFIFSGGKPENFNPILHGVGGGGTTEVPALVSKIRLFATNTATGTEFVGLFIKYIEEHNDVSIKPVPIKTLPWQPFFESRFDNFHINLLKNILCSSFFLFKCLI